MAGKLQIAARYRGVAKPDNWNQETTVASKSGKRKQHNQYHAA
jgi:hypothetical protein